MNLPELEAIRQRAGAAIKPPWRLETDSCDCGDGYGCSHGSWPHAFRLPVPYKEEWTDGRVIPTADHHYSYSDLMNLPMETAEFIVHAREDVPRLLSIVGRLLALAGEWDAKAKEIGDQITYQDTEGAVAGFKMIGYQNHRDHAKAIRDAVTAGLAAAAGDQAVKAGVAS